MRPVERLIALLDGVKPRGPGCWVARCPAHSDRTPSLSVQEVDDGRVLLHDFGGCDTEKILAFVGLEFRDIMPEHLDGANSPRAQARPYLKDVILLAKHETNVAAITVARVLRGEKIPEEWDRLTRCYRILTDLCDAMRWEDD